MALLETQFTYLEFRRWAKVSDSVGVCDRVRHLIDRNVPDQTTESNPADECHGQCVSDVNLQIARHDTCEVARHGAHVDLATAPSGTDGEIIGVAKLERRRIGGSQNVRRGQDTAGWPEMKPSHTFETGHS